MFEKYDAYKDSGLESFPEIPKNWQLKKLKFLLDEVNIRSETGDETLLSLSKYKGAIPKDSLDERAGSASTLVGYKKVFKHNLVINKMQAVNGLLAVSELEGITSPDYSVYSAKDNSVNIHYIAFLLNQPEYLAEMKKRVTGVMEGFIRLYTDDLYDIKAILPSIKEQNCIVDFLQKKLVEIDQAIAIKEQQIALLNERKQIVIQKAVTQGLEPNVPMKNSGVEWIGQIPEHWECKPSRYAFRAVKRFKRDGTEIKFSVTQKWGVIPTDEMQESATQAVSFDGFQICLEDDLVLNKYKAHLGVFWRAPSRGLITGNYTVFEPLKGINSKYFELLYHTPVYIDIFRTIVYGVIEGMMPLYNNDFYDMLSIVPPLEEQLAIVQYVGEQQKVFSKIERVFLGQIEKLKEYKTTLINDAVTGKIKVA